MGEDTNKSRSRKLAYWLEYALDKFGLKFWKKFSEIYPEQNRYFAILEMLATYSGLQPLPAKQLRTHPKLSNITSQEAYKALQYLMKVVAFFEMENDISFAQKVVLKTHPKESAEQEVLKLAKRVSKATANKALGFQQSLDQYTDHNLLFLEEFKSPLAKHHALFEADWQAQEQLTLIMKWRHFIAARNFEQTTQQPDYTICRVSLSELNRDTARLLVDNKLIQFYQSLGNFIDAPIWEGFYNLKALITTMQESQFLERDELADPIRLLINFLLRQLPFTNPQQLHELKQLYLEHTEDQLLLRNGCIQQRDFKSLISVLIRLNEISEARIIFEKYKDCIQDDHHGVLKTYNEGVILFYEGEFESAGRQFRSVMGESQDYYLKTDGKLYALRSLVALQVKQMNGEIAFTLGPGENFKVFYNRLTSLSKDTRDNYKQAIKILLNFSTIWSEVKHKRIPKWKLLKEQTQLLNDKILATWIETQIDQCIQHHSNK